HRDQVLALWHDSTLWRTRLAEETILPRLMRRFAATGAQKDLATCVELFRLAPEKKHGLIFLKGFQEAYKGRPTRGVPPALVEEIAKLGGGSIAFAVRQGKKEALAEALALVRGPKTPLAKREELIAVLAEAREPASVPVLLDIVTSEEAESLRRSALAG